MLNVASERRCSFRKSYDEPVYVLDHDHGYFGNIHNLSSCGMYIYSNRSYSVGQSLKLTFSLPNNGRKLIKITARIVRIDSNGFAVSF